MHFSPLGDRALIITLGSAIDEPTHRLVREASARLDRAGVPGVVDQVPAFASLTVHYDPLSVPPDPKPGASPYQRIVQALREALHDLRPDAAVQPRTVEIPVCYGGDCGPDLADLAARHGLSADEIVAAHAGASYVVYMLGFMPGFAYLGGLPDRLATPRRAAPRAVVPAGSVGIGGQQTGVYPLDSPGGWHLIGRTPLVMFEAARTPAALLGPGDRVRFRPVSRAEYRRLSAHR